MCSSRQDMIAVSFFAFVILSVISTSSVFAEDMSRLNAGDTSWVLTSSALALAMIVLGLSIFYGGMVRCKTC